MAILFIDPTPRFPKGWLTPEQRALKLLVETLCVPYAWPTVANDASESGKSAENHGKVSEFEPETPTVTRQ